MRRAHFLWVLKQAPDDERVPVSRFQKGKGGWLEPQCQVSAQRARPREDGGSVHVKGVHFIYMYNVLIFNLKYIYLRFMNCIY